MDKVNKILSIGTEIQFVFSRTLCISPLPLCSLFYCHTGCIPRARWCSMLESLLKPTRWDCINTHSFLLAVLNALLKAAFKKHVSWVRKKLEVVWSCSHFTDLESLSKEGHFTQRYTWPLLETSCLVWHILSWCFHNANLCHTRFDNRELLIITRLWVNLDASGQDFTFIAG